MPRPPASKDVFLAIAEPQRREILSLLGRAGESGVGAIALSLDMAQPAASKHLGVLREAGVVSVRRDGRRRLYSLQADRLRAVHEWTRTFERYWSRQTDRIKARAEQAAGPAPHAQERNP